jgi:hypothetical protein
MMNNLVISRMLRGVRLAQEEKYNQALEWNIPKVTSQGTISRLKAVVGKVADAHWNRVTTLTKGQAIAVFPDQWTEPTLVKIAPPPFRVLKVM